MSSSCQINMRKIRKRKDGHRRTLRMFTRIWNKCFGHHFDNKTSLLETCGISVQCLTGHHRDPAHPTHPVTCRKDRCATRPFPGNVGMDVKRYKLWTLTRGREEGKHGGSWRGGGGGESPVQVLLETKRWVTPREVLSVQGCVVCNERRTFLTERRLSASTDPCFLF